MALVVVPMVTIAVVAVAVLLVVMVPVAVMLRAVVPMALAVMTLGRARVMLVSVAMVTMAA